MHQVEMVDSLHYLNCIIVVKLQCTRPQKQLSSRMVKCIKNLPFLLDAFTHSIVYTLRMYVPLIP